jgi:hypothetical protein
MNPNSTRSLERVKVSVWVAVASSRFSSEVSSGMAAMKCEVMFWLVNFGNEGGIVGGDDLVGVGRDRAMMAARAAPPVMTMGARVWFSI